MESDDMGNARRLPLHLTGDGWMDHGASTSLMVATSGLLLASLLPLLLLSFTSSSLQTIIAFLGSRFIQPYPEISPIPNPALLSPRLS